MTVAIDYARFARQIALPEVGAEGQRRLAQTPVALGSLPPEAAELYRRAGGCTTDGPCTLTVEVPTAARAGEISQGPASLGVGAWGAVEAARRALGEAPAELPRGLLDRLGAP